MTPAEFLQRVWPSTGYYVIAKPYLLPDNSRVTYSHKVFETIDAAAKHVAGIRAQHDVFYGVHSLKAESVWNPDKVNYKTGEKGAPEVRTQRNMLAARCFFLDLDVGADPKKYPSPEAACNGIREFCRETGLPKPMLLSSGGGVHVYWLLSEDVPSDVWRTHAANLKKLCYAHRLLADPMRTADASSVLRVAGTFNHKNPMLLRKVKVILEGTPVSLERFVQAVSVGLIRAGKTPDTLPQDNTGIAGSVPTDSDLGSNTGKVYDGPPVSIKALGKVCKQVQRFAKLGGNVSEPEWYVMLQLIRFTEDGDKWCHELSKGHPDYSAETTEQKLDMLRTKDVAPSLCVTIADRCGPELCELCPHFGRIKTPLVAARHKDIAPSPLVPTALPDVPDLVIPDPPPPFKRLKSGSIAFDTQNSEGTEISVIIYEHDIYPVRRIENTEQGTERIVWRAHLPLGKISEFSIEAGAIYRIDALAGDLANHGVYPNVTRMKEMQQFMSAYIAELQKAQEASESFSSLGWHKDHSTFVLREFQLLRDGSIVPSYLTSGAESASGAIGKSGTLAKQVKLLEFYDKPEYKAQQFMVLASLAAPLFHMTGHAGVVVNATGVAGSSKSTSLYTGAGLWGHPTKYPLNGTAHGATQRARMQRMTTMGSLPVCVDEITTMHYKEAQELVMASTQPAPRVILNRDSTERASSEGDKSTIMLCTANTSLHALLSFENSAGTAGSMRVFEITMTPPKTHTKAEADEYLRQVKLHYGHVGEAFMAYVVQNYDAIAERLHVVMKSLDERCNIAGSERFWSGAAAAVIVAGEIAIAAQLIRYNVVDLTEWIVEDQIPRMRGLVLTEYNTPIGTLADYLESIDGNIIVVSKAASGPTYVKRAPKGAMLAHCDESKKQLWILRSGFKQYCARIGANATSIIRDLRAASPDDEHRRPILMADDVKRTLGLGTEFGKMQSRCIILNLDHPSVTGAVKLTVVEGGHPQTAPAKELKS